SPDGRTLATGGRDRIVRLWDVSTGRPKEEMTGHHGQVLSLCFSPDGKTLASGAAFDDLGRAPNGERLAAPGGQAKLWDVREGKRLRTLDDPHAAVYHLAFGRDGRTLFTGSTRLRKWDLKLGGHGRERQTRGWEMAVSPDGRLLATGGRVIEILTGKVLWKEKAATPVAFSPDGDLLASGGNSTVTIWDAVEGVAVREIRGHQGKITALAFSPDGLMLAAADDSTQVLLWDVRGMRPRETKGGIDVEQAYRELGDEDPKKAHQAIRQLASDPKRAVPHLAKSLRPAFHDVRRPASQLIEDLGADDFEVRQGASAALAKLDEGVVPRLRGALLAKDVSLELRHRA